MKQWHPPGFALGALGGILVAASGFWVWIIIARRYVGLFVSHTSDGKTETTGLGTLGLLADLGLAFIVGRLVLSLFPDPVFRVGDGVVRHDRVKSVRSKLGWALLAAGVLTPLVRVLSGLFR